MEFLTYLAIFLVLWGTATLGLAVFKPQDIWRIGKIQGFVQLLGETGTQIFLGVFGIAALAGGIWMLAA